MKFLRITALCLMCLALCFSAQALSKNGYDIEPPVPDDYEMPYTITVYIPNQMVVVYHADTLKPARSMICSSGKGNLTPRGTFRMPSTYTSGWDRWGNVYVRYPTCIKKPYYFHSILYRASDKALDMESWRKLGQKASHGCIRMTPLDAQWINYNCKRGTRIRIVNARGEGLDALHDQIKAQLNRNGHSSVLPTLKPTPTPIPPTIDAGSGKIQAIKALQNSLKSHGFYNGALTGAFDSATIAAWNAYQKAKGWVEDSIATTDEQITLANDQDTVGYNVNLSTGFTGVIVKKVEERLAYLKFFAGTPNNTYDASTVAAVKKFQIAGGILPANGKLPAEQQRLLFSGTAPTPTPLPDLRLGSRGTRVKNLQQRLFTLGFYAGAVTGKFQAATASAVSAYQQAAGLSPTGTANSDLQQMILNDNTLVGTARRLALKSKGVVVIALESKLQLLGLFAGNPDTVYDAMTVRAVKAFQTQKGLSATGVATSSVQKLIFDEPISGDS